MQVHRCRICTCTWSHCAPVKLGYVMHTCGVVRHGYVELGLVSTQDRHKYNTCHSLFALNVAVSTMQTTSALYAYAGWFLSLYSS